MKYSETVHLFSKGVINTYEAKTDTFQFLFTASIKDALILSATAKLLTTFSIAWIWTRQ